MSDLQEYMPQLRLNTQLFLLTIYMAPSAVGTLFHLLVQLQLVRFQHAC